MVIEAKEITKTYGKGESAFTALNGVSLSVQKGESVAIVGKSGSGKSTLMHLLALMDSPTSGSLSILGSPTEKMKNKDLNKLRNETFGFVFQQYFLNSRQSVLDNVVLPLKIAGMGKKEREEKARAALDAVDMLDKIKNKANDLSGGQKQRVCIARALVNEPRLLFADEFTGSLDSKTGAEIQDLIFDLNKKKGTTLVVITHDLELAARCQRQIHIRDGLVEAHV